MTPPGRSLAQRQADLVASLVTGGPIPAGFDPARVAATVDALLRKRAEEVGARWPALRAHLDPQWMDEFSQWAQNQAAAGLLARRLGLRAPPCRVRSSSRPGQRGARRDRGTVSVRRRQSAAPSALPIATDRAWRGCGATRRPGLDVPPAALIPPASPLG